MIVIPEDQLRVLEKKYGPDVRLMGNWNSDGVFGFCSVPFAVIEKAAESVGAKSLSQAVRRLRVAEDRTQPFIDMVRAYGPSLVRQIAVAHREHVTRSYTAPLTRTANGSV